mmetsp:Transcript_75174/g.156640  ORF Transcript_75174/g.156640 Transcript_75174/m.156640 type:complete len:443 (-) Transcript_75174:64-1392(-)|eukprot:CAMPEP_0206423408 /NCGR_PEP_ID=MMETSP0324_2-20121206/2662_1 /ASSEMBLY_ACC=CAM_ASM_000836 /TAXON_ID=2866 /ORGANISM="Crypthecodinium cohnii, Strain Seligo" /LENGTH=442 /DNA_ID=CAMNT_0053887961 /DNA_START=34 /DNA_END=1362 /DNA_ORIENTATION=-
MTAKTRRASSNPGFSSTANGALVGTSIGAVIVLIGYFATKGSPGAVTSQIEAAREELAKPHVSSEGPKVVQAPTEPPTSTTTTTTPVLRVDLEHFRKVQKPVFVHVPKTGGTSIEQVLSKDKLNTKIWGGKWCLYHTPPENHVRDSWGILRKVLSRLRSEFCWVRIRETFQTYKPYGATEVWPYTCEMYNNYVVAALTRYKEDPIWADCHMIPQWCYFSQMDFAIPHTRELTEKMQILHPQYENVQLGHSFAESYGKDEGPCDRFSITNDCLNASTLKMVHEHFIDDFEYLEPFYATLDAAEPKTWRIPGTLELSPISKAGKRCKASLITLREGGPDCHTDPAGHCAADYAACGNLTADTLECGGYFNYHGTPEGGPADSPTGGRCECTRAAEFCEEEAKPLVTRGMVVKRWHPTRNCPADPLKRIPVRTTTKAPEPASGNG